MPLLAPLLPLQLLFFLILPSELAPAREMSPEAGMASVVSGAHPGVAGCRLALDGAARQPGDVFLAIASCDRARTRITARFEGMSVSFFPVGAASRPAKPGAGFEPDDRVAQASVASEIFFAALLGIDLAGAPGAPELTWEADFGGGELAGGMQLIRIESRRFPRQRLRVAKRYVQPDSASLERILEESRRMDAVLSSSLPERLWRGAFSSPVPGARGTGFGARRVLNGAPSEPHEGIDLHVPAGGAVFAPNAGVVVLMDTLYYGGKTVVLDHGLGLFTIYSHLSQASVFERDIVEKGRLLGRVGATGRTTGPHLHWGVRLNGARVDPVSLIAATRGVKLDAAELQQPARPLE